MSLVRDLLRPASSRDMEIPDAARSDSARNRRLRRIVAHARENVPYYRELFECAGLTPGRVQTVEDLSLIPVTSRRRFQEAQPREILSRTSNARKLLVFRTSGATGEPLTVYQSHRENFFLHVLRLRALRAMGLRWRDRMIKVRSRAHARRPASWRLFERLGILKQDPVEARTPELMAADLRDRRADVLMGYTGALLQVGQILAAEGKRRLQPRLLVCGSETMTPFIRAELEASFRAEVRDTYICQETGLIAWECPASGLYHVLDDYIILEVLRDGRPCGPGEEGEAVVTNLVCRSMPFIRYRLEDRVKVAATPCPCGRKSLTLECVRGKMQDYFRLPGGREFNPWDLSGMWMGRAPWILQFELVQEEPASVVMRIVPKAATSAGEVEELSARSRDILGSGISFRVEIVDEIKPAEGGKFRAHRSLVWSIYDGSPEGSRPR